MKRTGNFPLKAPSKKPRADNGALSTTSFTVPIAKLMRVQATAQLVGWLRLPPGDPRRPSSEYVRYLILNYGLCDTDTVRDAVRDAVAWGR